MRVTLIDDSLPFDGHTPSSQPLGGAEKAFASLPGALAGRGHEVQVFNRCHNPLTAEGARWETWDSPRPAETDVLIAYRRPGLLGAVETCRHRVLWLSAPADYLAKPASARALTQYRPTLVFAGRIHRDGWSGRDAVEAAVIPPGVRRDYLEAEPMAPADPPRAIATTHPLAGLDWLLDLWTERINPILPTAELHVYSAALDRAALGGTVPEAYKPMVEKALAAQSRGVVVHRPRSDPDMADAYRAARVHLYPGSPREMYCATLAESQATGLPAVARPVGATAERIRDGETGYLARDADAFVSCALRLLSDADTFRRLSAAARETQRGMTWDAVAERFEALWA